MSDKYAVSSLGDLEQYGLNCLTGEACAYSMRLLFDYNIEGASLLADFFGFAVDLHAKNNWNSSVDGRDAIGSVMLTADTAWELAAFAMLRYGYERVVPNQPNHHGVYGFNMTNDYAEEYMEEHQDEWRIYRNPQGGSRNTHQMSGRTV